MKRRARRGATPPKNAPRSSNMTPRSRVHGPRASPGDVPPRRWQRFVDNIAQFIDDGWAEKATALGWGPLDLFGADRERPFARIDQAGLLWLLNGDKLLKIAAARTDPL